MTRVARLFETSMTTACRACWLLHYDGGDGFEVRPQLTNYSNRRGGRAVECTGLENRQGLIALRGFESTLSANVFLYIVDFVKDIDLFKNKLSLYLLYLKID